MNILLDAKPKPVSTQDPAKEIFSSVKVAQVESISFRQCRGDSGRLLKAQKSQLDCSWNRILTKVRANSPEITRGPANLNQQEAKSFERREFPRHSSEAIVLAFSYDEQNISGTGNPPGDKGYAINVSQNGISFASRSQFNLRDELQLHVEDHRVKFALDVTASVVRATPLDDQFWRIDCKLAAPLSDQQVALLKEHVPSCYAG